MHRGGADEVRWWDYGSPATSLVDKGYSISLRTALGCTFRGSAYCQLIRDANKTKRLHWAQQHLHDSFEDVIWSDKFTVQMESHRRFVCRKRGEAKPRWETCTSYRLWNQETIIIMTGTCTCTCRLINVLSTYTQTEAHNQSPYVGRDQREGRDGNLCLWRHYEELFVEILDGTQLPFVKDVYPSGHKFMQDNDPKHTSGYAE